jgi:hypothetical protein
MASIEFDKWISEAPIIPLYKEFAARPVLPTERELAVEIVVRYPNGNNRGTPIAKKAFIDCYWWIDKWFRDQVKG